MLKIDDIAEDQIVFYDLETDSQFAPYCALKMIGVQYGLRGEPELVKSWGERKRFREAVANEDILKVQFNGINFDDLVLYRHGYPVEERNRHDVFLMAKTVAPGLPAYAQAFVSWFYFGDIHEPEGRLFEWLKLHHKKHYWQAPHELLWGKCSYDVCQTVRLFKLFWEVVQRPQHWKAYTEVELPVGLPLEEMMLRGGEYLDEKLIYEKITELENEKGYWEDRVYRLSKGRVVNPNSTKQIGSFLQQVEGMELELTDKGNFSLKKNVLLSFLDLDDPSKDKSEVIRCLFEVRQVVNTLGYYRNYLQALNHSVDHLKREWIPKQFSTSAAKTRRLLSNSMYGLNFQNPSDRAEMVQRVPSGWLGVWLDATQIENVVHIYESSDKVRRADYEANPEWNEYVWLANQLLHGSYTKEELDDVETFPFPANPIWSMYKGQKTTKLMLNFGGGAAKFAKLQRMSQSAAKAAFEAIHRACPAIRRLQRRVAIELQEKGFVSDTFGHIYTGDSSKAYKVVAYLIQGCGTGSLPKKQIRAVYDVIHKWDAPLLPRADKQPWKNVIIDKDRKVISYGVMCGTTHDEVAARLSLALTSKEIVATLQLLHKAMTDYSQFFDGIPIRCKVYLSRTYTSEKEEVNVNNEKEIMKFL